MPNFKQYIKSLAFSRSKAKVKQPRTHLIRCLNCNFNFNFFSGERAGHICICPLCDCLGLFYQSNSDGHKTKVLINLMELRTKYEHRR